MTGELTRAALDGVAALTSIDQAAAAGRPPTVDQLAALMRAASRLGHAGIALLPDADAAAEIQVRNHLSQCAASFSSYARLLDGGRP